MNIIQAIKGAIKKEQHKYLEFIDDDELGTTIRFLKPGSENKKTRISQKDKYFRVVTGERDGEAEVFLYGFIGQDFWWDEDMKKESITDISFIQSFRELEKEYKRINIRINSPGGSVMHGDPIIAAIRNSKAEVHTFVDGTAASMAADIWMAGHQRHMGVNSKLMIHSTWSVAIGNAKDMRASADQLDKFDESAIATFSKATGWSEDDTKDRFYNHEDHWLTAKDVAELGLIERVEDYQTDNQDEKEKKSHIEALKAVIATVDIEKEEKSLKTAEKRPTSDFFDQDTDLFLKKRKLSK
jgi:ATP-dependent Clp endopeptidase proteolytic subunit ClpP